MAITVAKYNKKFYQVLKVVERIHFSDERGWVLLVNPINDLRAFNLDMKWVRNTSRFDWVRTFSFDQPKDSN